MQWIPVAFTTRAASVRLDGLEARYGMRIAKTLSGPRARAQRKAVTAESTPPESPITARRIFLRRISSSRKKATSQFAVTCGSRPGGSRSVALGSTIGSVTSASRQGKLGIEQEIRQNGGKISEQRQRRSRAVDLT